MKNEHPIIFSTLMVQAILDGRKTQTRRIVKQTFHPDTTCVLPLQDSELFLAFDEYDRLLGGSIKCPYGNVGDTLWVRESAYYHKQEKQWFYKATDPLTDSIEYGYRWKPSIHMPRKAARLILEIINVRVERVQDISEKDCKDEGCNDSAWHNSDWKFPIYVRTDRTKFKTDIPKSNFASLWETINGPGAWQQNPWVWVIEFNRI